MQEMPVWSLGWEDPLEKEMATHSSVLGTSLVAQMIKNLPAMKETWVQSLVRKDPFEKSMATHSSPVFLPGKSQEQKNLFGYSPWDRKRVRHNFATKQQFQTLF